MLADVAKLADAIDLGSIVYDVQVQVLSSAPASQQSDLCKRLSFGRSFCFYAL